MAVTLIYSLCSVALFDWANPLSNDVTGQPFADGAQEIWFLSWFAHAVAHLQNPFITHAMNVPHGINLMANTSMPLLGIFFAPVTWIFGPVAAFNFLLHLGLVSSALAVVWVARRIGINRVGAFFAGLVYGFSTMQTVASYGHLFLTFAPLPPLILLVIWRLISGHMNSRHAGLSLGLLWAADFLISAERAAITLVVIPVVAILALPFTWRNLTYEMVRRICRAMVWCAGTITVVLALPLFEILSGPYAVRGASHPWIQSYHSDLLSIIFPQQFAIAPFLGHRTFIRILSISPWENGSYVGPLLLGVVVATFWYMRKHRHVVWMSASALVLIGMSCGTVLSYRGALTRFHSPYTFIATLPFFSNILPVRYMTYAWLAIALVVGYVISELLPLWTTRPNIGRVLSLVVVLLGIISIAPRHSIPNESTNVPSWLTSSEAQRVIPSAGVVLFYPYPTFIDNRAMLDQAVADLRFNIIGGQALFGQSGTGVNSGIPILPPSVVPSIFFHANAPTTGDPTRRLREGINYRLLPLPSLKDGATALRVFVDRWHVDTIVLNDFGNYRLAENYVTAAFGPGSSRDGGTVIFWKLR